MNENEQTILESEWQRLAAKYNHGSDYKIVCQPNGKCDEKLPWNKNSRIRGEVIQAEKTVYLYDTKLDDKLECARHEFFEAFFDVLVQQYINLCNSFEVSINHMISEQNKMSDQFMQDCYLKKERFINIFVEIEKNICNNQNKKLKVKKK